MKVRIVCYENPGDWIVGKFASRLNQELCAMGMNSSIANVPDNNADVNHHLIYLGYDGCKHSLDTLMITHIDTVNKFRLLRRQLQFAEMGICMSRFTMTQLASAGIPPGKLCFVNPAHDGLIRPRPLLVGIASRVYPDGRKREYLFEEMCRSIKPEDFRFWIMGHGWETMAAKIRNMGFTVDFVGDFDNDLYSSTIPTLDYFLYFGNDEGPMGILDAISAGVKTIMPTSGFQADISNGITHPISDANDLVRVFNDISRKRNQRIDSIGSWTWENYVRKHLLLWEYLLGGRNRDFLERNRTQFPDGLATLDNLPTFLPRRLLRKVFFFRSIIGNSLKLRFRKISEKSRK